MNSSFMSVKKKWGVLEISRDTKRRMQKNFDKIFAAI